ncbi:MarR family winged helix-turn-helix transcriptional regulator [Catellatospora paridis]|uniref:MarR family winged helix-turn-helix transcriptional regulator n=1 Tax=Catellatospora paridis TaxID=1617086 RepID=UPI0012D47857|nr:MarR family transcriptional regulator [Catellatospora paridis]
MTHDTPRPRRARQLPTTEELRIWRDFIETADTLRSELTARLQSESSLSSGDYAVLLALNEAEGHRMRSSELAAHIDWERSRLSHHLGRMERRDLIRREECAADSRGAEIVLTPTGLQSFRQATVPHLRAVRELFVDALTHEQLIAAGDLAATLRARLSAAGRQRGSAAQAKAARSDTG